MADSSDIGMEMTFDHELDSMCRLLRIYENPELYSVNQKVSWLTSFENVAFRKFHHP